MINELFLHSFIIPVLQRTANVTGFKWLTLKDISQYKIGT
jgi:hypothetical protein